MELSQLCVVLFYTVVQFKFKLYNQQLIINTHFIQVNLIIYLIISHQPIYSYKESKMNISSNSKHYDNTMVYQYSLALIRKIKHQFYDLLEQTIYQNNDTIGQQEGKTLTNDVQNSNPQLLQYQFKPISFIDPLDLLENLPFSKYQQQLIQLINLCSSNSQQTSLSRQQINQETGLQDKQVQVQQNQVQEALLLLSEKYVSQKSIDQKQQNEQQFASPSKPCQCSCQNSLSSKDNQFLSGQRQLQLLIKQKQTTKKIIQLTSQLTQLTQELQQIKRKLQNKQSQIHILKKQLHLKDKSINQLTRETRSLKLMIEDQHMMNERGEKVNSLKGKIKLESMRREISLQREWDNMELMIEKENINSNYHLSYLENNQKPLDSSMKRPINSLKSLDNFRKIQKNHLIENQHNHEDSSNAIVPID